MDENNIQSTVNQFQQRGVSYLQSLHKNSVLQIQDNLTLLKQAIAAEEDEMAISEWRSINDNKIPGCLIAPQRMRLGQLQLMSSKGKSSIDIPLLLPMQVNGILINVGTDAERVPNLFQNIILRLLLSMRMDLVKVSVVDMDYGNSFPILSAITNPMFKSQMIYRQEDVTKLIDELGKEISEANRNYLGCYPDIDTYNANAGEMAQPYHFVFIDDFPNGFSPQSIDNLLRLIGNGNALRAGIRIFINYSQANQSPRDFDLQRFEICCSWINKESGGNYSFQNWKFKYSQSLIPQIELKATDKATEYIDFLNNIKPRSVSYSLDGWIETLKKTDQVWKGSTLDGINVPIGYITPTKTFDFYMANDNDGSCNDFFALIAGRPGYGKTVLLHNIIVNAAMKYSPDELCLYLADFAEGASFYMYRDLPHVKSLMLSNNKEYALRMLDDIVLEAKKRSDLYKKAQRQYCKQISKLSDYRAITGELLPRILFVMDEFHTLFISTDNTTIRAKEELCNGIRQWRKFGISIILCTQSISGVNFGSADTQITYRFAMNLLEMDSKSVIRNDAAKMLARKGQTIMNNTADGKVDMNVEFQSAFSPHYLDHVHYLSQLYTQKYKKKHTPYICEDETDADILDNHVLTNLITTRESELSNNYCDVFVGKPDLLRDNHTRIRYRRQQNSNTLIIGDDYRTLVFDIMTQLIQIRFKSSSNSKFYVLDCFNVGDPFQGALNEMKTLSDCFMIGQSQDSLKYIEDVYSEMERRKVEQKEGRMTEERIVLAIMNTQNCYDLKPQPGKFGAEPSETTKKLIALLTEGSPLGIHCIVHGLSYETLFKVSGILESNKHFSLFENLILLKGADVVNMFLAGLKISAPEEVGRMIVVNAKIDGEPYEQCNAYSSFSSKEQDPTTKFMSNLFDNYQYV